MDSIITNNTNSNTDIVHPTTGIIKKIDDTNLAINTLLTSTETDITSKLTTLIGTLNNIKDRIANPTDGLFVVIDSKHTSI